MNKTMNEQKTSFHQHVACMIYPVAWS